MRELLVCLVSGMLMLSLVSCRADNDIALVKTNLEPISGKIIGYLDTGFDMTSLNKPVVIKNSIISIYDNDFRKKACNDITLPGNVMSYNVRGVSNNKFISVLSENANDKKYLTIMHFLTSTNGDVVLLIHTEIQIPEYMSSIITHVITDNIKKTTVLCLSNEMNTLYAFDLQGNHVGTHSIDPFKQYGLTKQSFGFFFGDNSVFDNGSFFTFDDKFIRKYDIHLSKLKLDYSIDLYGVDASNIVKNNHKYHDPFFIVDNDDTLYMLYENGYLHLFNKKDRIDRLFIGNVVEYSDNYLLTKKYLYYFDANKSVDKNAIILQKLLNNKECNILFSRQSRKHVPLKPIYSSVIVRKTTKGSEIMVFDVDNRFESYPYVVACISITERLDNVAYHKEYSPSREGFFTLQIQDIVYRLKY